MVLEDQQTIRQEMIRLLRLQMDALNSPEGPTDQQLADCYARQAHIQQLREQLQATYAGSQPTCTAPNAA